MKINYEEKTNEKLLALHDKYYQHIVVDDNINELTELLEIERELTLRENK